MTATDSVIASLERAPELVIGLVRQADRSLLKDDWTRTGDHDEYNAYSVFMMFRHLALHDFFHGYRIEELVLRRDWPAPADPVL